MDSPSNDATQTIETRGQHPPPLARFQHEVAIDTKPPRKKTPGACEKCREKRIKCDGVYPCDQCVKKGHKCTFTFSVSTSNENLAAKFDLILKRLEHIDTTMTKHVFKTSNDRETDKQQLQLEENATTCVAEFNQQTGCLEYYGGTSTFVLATSLSKRLRQLEADTAAPRHKRARIDPNATAMTNLDMADSLGLDKLLGLYDYVLPANASLRRHRSLQKEVADRHLLNFFETIHIYLPIFDVGVFKEKYYKVRHLFGDNVLYVPSQDSQNRQHFLCLLYAVLALGALYEHGRDDSSSWAAWYFAEAQDALGQLLDAANLELVQAAMLMGAYAQHAIKPNLAYNLVGISTRLAFSIGLNTSSARKPYGVDDEEAKRTWWLIYVQEVELSLDSGRPMSIRSCDIDVNYPLTNTVSSPGPSVPAHCTPRKSTDAVTQVDLVHDNIEPCQAAFITSLAEIAKIVRRIMKLVNPSGRRDICLFASHALIETLQNALTQWKNSLPHHLRFQDEGSGRNALPDPPCSWKARQRSSLRIHYNLALIVLHRKWLTNPEDTNFNDLSHAYKTSCLQAASDMVQHIHHIFEQAPSLRRWSYYCYYCLQATLVLLIRVLDEPTLEETVRIASLCETSVRIFEQIELKASKRCAEVVRRVLDEWNDRRRVRQDPAKGTRSVRATNLQHHPFPSPSTRTEPWYAEENGNGPAATVEPQTGSSYSGPAVIGEVDKSRAATVRHDRTHSEIGSDFCDPSFDFLTNTDWSVQILEEFLNFPLPDASL